MGEGGKEFGSSGFVSYFLWEIYKREGDFKCRYVKSQGLRSISLKGSRSLINV